MRRIRIHVDLPLAEGTQVELPEAAAAHAVRVLRLKAGAAVTLFNGDGADYDAELALPSKSRVVAQVLSRRELDNESPLRLVLAQAVVRGDKMDLIVQKATELGVAGIVPLLTERSEVRLDGSRGDKRLAHWQAVASSACEQCGRARLPRIDVARALEAWYRELPDNGALRLALMPGTPRQVRTLQPPPAGAIIAVGPEGGFGARDVATLEHAGFSALGLGPRVLRTETAGLVGLAALQALHGDL